MAKRFIDTGFFKSRFVRGLEAPLKGLYCFLICECDGAGIWNYDLEIASIYVGAEITPEQFADNFIKTGKAVEIVGGRFFFPDFIEHQYPSGLQANNKAHKGFISTLESFDLIEVNECEIVVKKVSPFQAPSKPLPRVLGIGKGNSNGKGNGKGKGQVEKTNAPKKLSKVQFSDYPIQSDLFVNAWKEWLIYKTGESGRKEPYKTEQTELTALKKLARYAQEAQVTPDDKAAAMIVEQGISNEWEGLHPLKIESNGIKNNRRQSGPKLNLSPDEVANIVNS